MRIREGSIDSGCGDDLTHFFSTRQGTGDIETLSRQARSGTLKKFWRDCSHNKITCDDEQTDILRSKFGETSPQCLLTSILGFGDGSVVGQLLNLSIEMRPMAGDKNNATTI